MLIITETTCCVLFKKGGEMMNTFYYIQNDSRSKKVAGNIGVLKMFLAYCLHSVKAQEIF